MIPITAPGVFQMGNEEYHADPVAVPSMTRGTIFDLINETPAHAFHNHPRLSPKPGDDDEAKFDMGSAAHSLLLEGVDMAVVCDFPDWRTKDAKAARAEARLAGKIPFLAHQYQTVADMVAAAHRQLAASEIGIKNLHEQGDSEMTYVWEESGVWLRVRPDWISHKNIAGDRKLILDYKTTGMSASPDRFKPSDNGKDIQHALYRRGVAAVEAGKRPRFIFFVQETYPPYLGCLIGLDPQTIQIAEQKVDYGIDMWRECHRSGEWPGYPLRACYVESKPWEVAAWEYKAERLGTGE